MLRHIGIFLCVLIPIIAMGQNDDLARNYFQQGDYAKAAAIYEQLFAKNPASPKIISGLVASYQQLEQYSKAEELLQNAIAKGSFTEVLSIELANNYLLQGKEELATQAFDYAVARVKERPSLAFSVGKVLEKYNLIDQAISLYTMTMELDPRLVFDIQLAYLYGEKGDIEKMLSTFIELIRKDERYRRTAERTFSKFISEDPTSESNIIFKKILLQNMQTKPDILYNQLLSWLFTNQKEYTKAFMQEKAIYKRTNGDLQRIISLASASLEAGDEQASEEILNYIIENSFDPNIKMSAEQKLIALEVSKNKTEEFLALRQRFESLLEKYGKSPNTLSLQLSYAHFLAFNMNKIEEAAAYLKESLNLPLTTFEKSRIKIQLGDILILEEKFNTALIYYTQVERAVKDDELAQEAKFKVALTSYYNGDFEWSKTQLKVLKASATQLIANDAQKLFLLINDNIQEDSTHAALKKYAHADLLAFQNKNQDAIASYGQILLQHKGQSIEDEALLAQGLLFEKTENYTEAVSNYLKIISFYREDILADDAYYHLAQLYAGPLNQPDKAKEYYERIIFDHADSIYYVEARNQYRKLRGDTLN